MHSSLPRPQQILPLLAISMVVAGCELVGDILEFGFWTGVIVLILIIALIWWAAKKMGAGRRGPPPTA